MIIANVRKVYRTQYVSYNNCKSSLKDIVCGVPQDSILGPLLFILYVNGITFTSDVLDFVLFADDTTILFSHKNINSQVKCNSKRRTKRSSLSTWFKAINYQLMLYSKTKLYAILGTVPSYYDISLSIQGLENIIE